MSISIKNLHYDQRDVGKTIKATKKYYLWEFVLNGKYHKVEMFHSKVSGKKKLCLDAQMIIEDKGYKNDFQYSFKVEKNYFNITQTGNDRYEIRIDNKEFSMIMQEEKSGKLKEPEPEKTETEQTTSSAKSKGSTNPRNSDANFYANDDEDFDFSGGTSNTTGSMPASREKSASVAVSFGENSFNNLKNNFSNQSTQKQTANVQKQSMTGTGNAKGVKTGVLLDFSDITESKPKVQVPDQMAILSQINFSGNEINPEMVKHNQNIINNLNMFGEENQNEEVLSSVQQPPQPMNISVSTTEGSNPNFNNIFSNPTISTGNMTEVKTSVSDNNLLIPMSNTNSSVNQQANLFDNKVNIGLNQGTSEGSNEFKQKIVDSGLFDLNNILEDKKKVKNINTSNTDANYNFALRSSSYGNATGTTGYTNNPYSNPYPLNMNVGGVSGMNSGYGMMGTGIGMGAGVSMNPYGQMPYNQYGNNNTFQMNTSVPYVNTMQMTPNTVPSMESMNTSKSISNTNNTKNSPGTPFDFK